MESYAEWKYRLRQLSRERYGKDFVRHFRYYNFHREYLKQCSVELVVARLVKWFRDRGMETDDGWERRNTA